MGLLHHLVAGLFPEELWEPKRYNGGGELEHDQVEALASFLEGQVLPRLRDGERMFYREESEMWKNYSLHREVLLSIITFLRNARVPVAFH